MRKHIDALKVLKETEYKTKTKSALDTMLDVDMPTSAGEVSTQRASSAVAPSPVPGARAGRAKTRAAMNAPTSPEMAARWRDLASSGLEDQISDAEAADISGYDPLDNGVPEPVTTTTLPAVVNRALTDAGSRIQPEWHMVKDLPGYMASAIRAMGRMVFEPFTDTPIEEIQVLSSLSNKEIEVKTVLTWLTRNAIRDDEAELTFQEILPGYAAKTQIWNTADATFMAVKDDHGIYVYGWPGGRGVAVNAPAAMKQIG
jgi:hypothetical protein